METLDPINTLQYFFRKAKRDPCLSKSHLAVYVALLERWSDQGFSSDIRLFAKEGAQAARVSLGTYYQCIADLNHFGYIHYCPSFRSDVASLILLMPMYSLAGSS